jgi:hypothetical protein
MFLALRSQDCGKIVQDIKDWELAGEVEVYGGHVLPSSREVSLTISRQIMDDNFLHALRIFREKTTKAIRLQASVIRGEMKRYSSLQKPLEQR